MVYYPKATNVQEAVLVGTWKGTNIPIIDVPSMYALNQLVGYVKHINSGVGTVLYRGQNKLYPSVVPSIKHDLLKFQENQSRLESAIKAVLEDEPMKNSLD